jgi:hypothetical protein
MAVRVSSRRRGIVGAAGALVACTAAAASAAVGSLLLGVALVVVTASVIALFLFPRVVVRPGGVLQALRSAVTDGSTWNITCDVSDITGAA